MEPKACQHAARDSHAMWLLRPPVDMPLHDVPSELPMDEELRARLLMEGTTGGLAMQGVRPLGVSRAGEQSRSMEPKGAGWLLAGRGRRRGDASQ